VFLRVAVEFVFSTMPFGFLPLLLAACAMVILVGNVELGALPRRRK